MTPSFSPQLVNDVFGDPGLYVEVRWSRRALLFDLGSNESLSPTRLLRARNVFVSHTHMDHFIGFDRLLRMALGRGKTLRFYGPPGLIENVEGKLRRYTWNLIDGYPLIIEVREFHPHEIKVVTFEAGEEFTLQPGDSHPLDRSGVFPMLEDPMFSIWSVALNHRIPSLAFALQEQFHININKERLHAVGLPVGSWLKEVKQYLWEGRPDDFRFLATLYFEHRKKSENLFWVKCGTNLPP